MPESFHGRKGSQARASNNGKAVILGLLVRDDFGPLLAKLVKAAGYTVEGFAAAVGRTGGSISKVANGHLRPPLGDELLAWAAALHLQGARRDEFLREAYLAHTPPPIRAALEASERRLEQLEAVVKELRAEAQRLREQRPH